MSKANPDVLYLPEAAILKAADRFPTPFFLYEERRLRDNCRRFKDVFCRYFPDFSPLYAIKANTNPTLLKIIFSEGYGADASSEAEAWITNRLGATGVYSGNYTTEAEFRYVLKLKNFLINLDDISMLPTLSRLGMPDFLSFRVNPGISEGGMKSLLLAGPDAKYGVPPKDVTAAFRRARALGVKRFGIHMMTGSNVLNERYFHDITFKLLEIAGQAHRKLGITFERLNIGGGFGVPYRPEQQSLNLDEVARGVRRAYDVQCAKHNLPPPILMAEPGRYITADAGWLVARVHVVKNSFKRFAGIDAGMNDLPRPAIYDAYHHISVLCARKGARRRISVVGRLCENNDQFARDRMLPPLKPGDLLAIHNAGGHSYAMGHNYNNRLRSAEALLSLNGSLRRIRRAETIADLFKTTDIPD